MTLFACFAFCLCCKSALTTSAVANLIAFFGVFVVKPPLKIGKTKFSNRRCVVAGSRVKMLNPFNTCNRYIIGRLHG